MVTIWYWWAGRKKFGLGQSIYKGQIGKLDVPEFSEVTIYDSPFVDDSKASYTFRAGRYENLNIWFGWMGSKNSKLIEVRTTGIEKFALLGCYRYRHNNGKLISLNLKLEPVESSYVHDDRLLPNDWVECVRVPENSTVTLYDHKEYGGGHVKLKPGWHELKDYGLAAKVSSLRFSLDEWEFVGRELGAIENKKEVGSPVLSPFKSNGPAKEITESVTLTRETTKEEHINNTTGLSQSIEIGTSEASPVQFKSTTTASNETEVGKGTSETTSESSTTSVTIEPDENGQIEAYVLKKRYEGKQNFIKILKNKRTGAIARQKGYFDVHQYESEIFVKKGKRLY